jgi:phosphopantetheine adenylyltransferase
MLIVRGLRNVADFEYEQQIGWANNPLLRASISAAFSAAMPMPT